MAPAQVKCYFAVLLLVIFITSEISSVKIFRENCGTLKPNFNITDETLSKLIDDKIIINENLAVNCQSLLEVMQTVCDLSKSNDIASTLFYLTCNMGHQLKLLFHNLGIKYNEISDPGCLQQHQQKNKLRSRPTDVIMFLKDMMTRFNWNKIVLITDIDTEFFQKVLSSDYTSIKILHPSYVYKFFSNDTYFHGMHFFVLCSPAVTQEILQIARTFNVLNSPQTWVILSDINQELLLQNVSIPYNSYVAVATSTDNVALEFIPHKAALLWTVPIQQPITCSNLQQIQTEMSKVDLIKTSNIGTLVIDLSEVYSVKDDMPLQYRYFGRWVSISNPKLQIIHEFPNMIRNLAGIKLQVVTVNTPPYILLKNNTSDLSRTIEGVYGFLFRALAEQMNFTFNITVMDSYGKKNDMGEWSGLFQRLKEKTADIALCDLSVTKDRKEVADFSKPISRETIQLIYKIPDENYHFRLYIIPFGWQIWLLVSISIFVSGVLIYLTNRISPNSALKTTTDPIELVKVKHQFGLMDCFLAVYNGFNQQGTELEPKEVSGKIIFVSVYLSFVIIFSSYTSVFTSFLTIGGNKIRFETLEDIYNAKSYKIGVCKDTSQESLFKDEDNPENMEYKVWRRILQDPDNIVSSLKQGLDRAYTQEFALLTPKESTNYFLQNNCSFEFATESIISDSNHVAFRKNFPYAETFNKYIQILSEAGAIRRLHQLYKQDEIKFCNSDSTVKPLGFKKVVSLYLLLAGASLFAAAALGVEWLFRLTQKINKGNKMQAVTNLFNVKNLQEHPVNEVKSFVDFKPKTTVSDKAYYFS